MSFLLEVSHVSFPSSSRRELFIAAAGVAAVAGLSPAAAAAAEPGPGTGGSSTVTVADGTKIYYKAWGTGRPIVFSHGWPLTADAWDAQMLFLGANGFRVIAHDRRSHGRSDQTWTGNDMDTYADDLAAVLDALDVKDAMLVGHSTGGGEVARYIGRHGTSRVSKAVLIGAVPPIMLKTAANPGGLPMSVFDGIRDNVVSDRSGFYKTLAVPFYGFNKPGATLKQGVIDAFWLQGMTGGIKGQYDCIKQFSETDFTEDLRKMTIPTLVLHGDADQIVPIADSAERAVKFLPHATLKVYPGAPHGMCTTEAARVNADLLAFAKR